MNFEQLSAFCAVAENRSFRAAAQQLHKTQPAVSKLVQNLEEELGLVLFDRSQYRATLSNHGRLLYPRALRWLESSEALRSYARTLASGEESEVRLALDAVTPWVVVARVLQRVQQRFPDVRFTLRTERLEGAVEAVLEDQVDLAVALAPERRSTLLERQRFASVRIVAVARAGHALTDAKGPATRKLLRQYPQIVLSDSAQRIVGTSFNVIDGGLRWYVTDLAAKKELILQGMGWGGLPEHLVADALRSGELSELDIPEFESTELPLVLLRRRDRSRGPVHFALWKELARASRD